MADEKALLVPAADQVKKMGEPQKGEMSAHRGPDVRMSGWEMVLDCDIPRFDRAAGETERARVAPFKVYNFKYMIYARVNSKRKSKYTALK